jgi:hypothetical protein
MKRIIAMMHSFTKVYFDRVKKNCFDLLKQKVQEEKSAVAFSILKMARMRARSALGIWSKHI